MKVTDASETAESKGEESNGNLGIKAPEPEKISPADSKDQSKVIHNNSEKEDGPGPGPEKDHCSGENGFVKEETENEICVENITKSKSPKQSTSLCNGDTADADHETPAETSNNVDGGEDNEKGRDAKADPPEDMFYVHDAGITIKLVAPGAEAIELQVSSSELVQELHQLLMEREDTCQRTCFSLQLEGETLDNFAELKSIPGLKEGSVIKVVEEPYNCREARIHIKHVRDLLKPSDWADAYAGTECASLSFLNSVSGSELAGKKRVVDCTPPDYIMPGTSNSLLLVPIHPLGKDQKPITCLKVLAASGWNPPPGHRKLHGDLLYLVVVTLEDKTCHITASPRGFYLNRSTTDNFDPLPATPTNFLSHSLIDLLHQISPSFRKQFQQLQKRRNNRHPFERVATPYQVYTWTSPSLPHNLDSIRAEEAFSSKLGYEEHIPGQTRDWNEELQSTRELPRLSLPERLIRERAIFKVHSDFVSAATRGAVSVIDGNIMAINPGESQKMQMYIWSNIFFSLGFDVRDHYKQLGGDAAAHVAPRNDIQGVAAYNAIDLEGMFTLGTVVIDYRGYRVTAQSIIPGILEREQDQSVVYGSIDFGKTIVTNDKYLELLQKAAPRLKVLTHNVINEKNEVIELCSSVECKGIVGNDSRHYILDLLRTFPPDLNFLPVEGVAFREEVTKLGFPMTHPHKLCCLRQELVDTFVESRYLAFLKLVSYHMQFTSSPHFIQKAAEPIADDGKPAIKIETADAAQESKVEKEADVEEVNADPDAPKADEVLASDSSVIKILEGPAAAIKKAASAVCSLSETKFDIRFNPDLFSEFVKHFDDNDGSHNKADEQASTLTDTGTSKVATKKTPPLSLQIQLNREACEFLLLCQVPAFVKDIRSMMTYTMDGGATFFGCNPIVMDGVTFSTAMHGRGINMRYLGRIVQLLLEADEESKAKENGSVATSLLYTLPHFTTIIGVMELIARGAKHIFNPFIQNVDVMNHSRAISHFLNCLLTSSQNVIPSVVHDELAPFKQTRNGHRNKSKQKGGRLNNNTANFEWASLTVSSLWEQIQADIQKYYGFTFSINCQKSLDVCMTSFGIQKLSLLRSFCFKTGIQVQLREYQFTRTGNSKGGFNVFCQEDILNVFPIVKHIDPRASDAYTFLSTAQSKMSSGCVHEGFDLLTEALNLLNNVYGAMHPDIAFCLRLLARLNYVMGEHTDALAYQQKALFMCERILGIDHPTTILEFTHLSLYCFANNQVTTALKLLYRARYLSLLVIGENHPHVALLDSNIGLILHAVAEYELSLKFLEKALELYKKYFGFRSLKAAVGHHMVARTQSCTGDFRSALMNERETYSIYKEQLGEMHEKTLEAADCMKHLTEQAVVLQRKINEMVNGKGLPTLQIQPPSMGSVLDMLNLINGILFMQISQQDIENFKAELELRAQNLSALTGSSNAQTENGKNNGNVMNGNVQNEDEPDEKAQNANPEI